MTTSNENYIDHEVRLRVQESVHKEIRDSLKHLEGKVDSHFKWMLGTMLGLFVGIIGIVFPIFGGIILHMVKLI